MKETVNKVTESQVDGIIREGTLNVITMGEKTTLVEFTTKEGFVMVESSSCVDKANYNQEIGQSICLGRIRNKLWEYEGYCLQKSLYNQERSDDSEPSAKERVQIERSELAGRLEKLQQFISTNKAFSSLDMAQQYFLLKQRDIMGEYLDVLTLRLSIWRD